MKVTVLPDKEVWWHTRLARMLDKTIRKLETRDAASWCFLHGFDIRQNTAWDVACTGNIDKDAFHALLSPKQRVHWRLWGFGSGKLAATTPPD